MAKAGKDGALTPTTRRLVDAAAEIMGEPALTDRDRAFMARQLVQATLPHSDPGKAEAWQRTNGNLTLVIRPGWDSKKRCPVGYPYGTVPRLLLFWLTTEAVRTRSRILHPGNTVTGFMRELGLNPDTGGGKRGDARRLRDQMERLFRAIISFEITDDRSQQWLDMQIAPAGEMWWDFHDPDQQGLFQSWIELGEKFYEALIAAPVPVDMRALRALKRSPLALDLYAWATYRTFTVTQAGKPAFISCSALAAQIGGDYADLKDFRKKAIASFQKVQTVYPALRLGDAEGGFVLKPSASAVRSKAR
jgi:hypothetical protein